MKISLKFLSGVLILMTLGSCIEPKADNGQIVVVGNGSDWSQNLVVDIRKSQALESLVYSPQENLRPLSKKIEGVEDSSHLQWVKQTYDGSYLIEVEENSEKRIYEQVSDTRSVERRRDLESLKPWGSAQPQFLSDGAALFVNDEKDLQYSANLKDSSTLLTGVEEFRWAATGHVFARVGEDKWNVIPYSQIKYADKDQPLIPVSLTTQHLFESNHGEIYTFKMLKDNFYRPPEYQFLKWNGKEFERLNFRSSVPLLPDLRSLSWDPDEAHLVFWNKMGNQFQLIVLGEDGIESLPNLEFTENIIVAQGGIFLISNKVQICRKPAATWVCKEFGAPPHSQFGLSANLELVFGLAFEDGFDSNLSLSANNGLEAQPYFSNWKSRLQFFDSSFDSPEFGSVLRVEDFEGKLENLRLLRVTHPKLAQAGKEPAQK